MALTRAVFTAGLNVSLTKTNAGFQTVSLADAISFSLDADVTAFTAAYIVQGAIANTGAGITTVDLFTTLTDLLGNSFAAKTKLLGIFVKTTGTAATASLRIAPGATNPVTLGLGADGGSLDDKPFILTKAGGAFLHVNPADGYETISTSAKNIDLSNPGSTAVTYQLGVILG